MIQQTIDTTDTQLTALLIARMLQDKGMDLDAAKIVVSRDLGDGVDTRLRVRYPLRGLKVVIQSGPLGPGSISAKDIVDLAEQQAADYRRLYNACGDLEQRLAQAKATAKREIAVAKRRGVPIKFLDVRPTMIDAGTGSLPSPAVTIEVLSAGLMPKRELIAVESEWSIIGHLANHHFLVSQAVRSCRKAWFNAERAGGAIDAVIPKLLQDAGHQVSDLIRRMRSCEAGLSVECNGRPLQLSWNDGLISGSFAIDELISYAGGVVSIECELDAPTRHKLVGLPASAVAQSDILESSLIAAATNVDGALNITLQPRYLMFDADTLEVGERHFLM